MKMIVGAKYKLQPMRARIKNRSNTMHKEERIYQKCYTDTTESTAFTQNVELRTASESNSNTSGYRRMPLES
jgi:hypothetical protein